jgi:hypothetical protein
MDNDEVINLIENEGIGYAVMCYTDGSSFEDEKLRQLWAQARESLEAINDYLGTD